MSLIAYGLGYGSTAAIIGIATIICAVLAIAGAILLMVLFLCKKNANRFKGFAGWLYDFLNFKVLLSETILRVFYLITTCFITLYSVIMLFFEPLSALLLLTVGNIVIRLVYEFMLITLIICKNTSEISKHLGGKSAMNASFVDLDAIASKAPKSEPKPEPAPAAEANVFCPSCRAKVDAESAFCPNCGAKIK